MSRFTVNRSKRILILNFLTGVARRYYQDVPAWLIAALAAERITTTVIRGGQSGTLL